MPSHHLVPPCVAALRFGSGAPFRTGCTAVVDAIFTGDALGADGILIDITAAQRVPVF